MDSAFGRVTLFTVLVTALSFGVFAFVFFHAAEVHTYNELQLHVTVIDTSLVSAQSLVAFDLETGTILTAKEADTVFPIASITKLITAALTHEADVLEATTTIVGADLASEGKAGKLALGQTYSLRELLYPLLLESSNDAAATFARVEPDLLERMHTFVTNAGATKTQFGDTSGLSDGNVSTAAELAVLTKKIYTQYPHIFDITQLDQFIGTYTGWGNNNPLVTEDGYEGGKHGFTESAGKTVVAIFNERLASGTERKVGYVLLQSDNLKTDIRILREAVRSNVRFE